MSLFWLERDERCSICLLPRRCQCTADRL